MTRTMVLVSSLVLCAGALTACGGGTAPEASTPSSTSVSSTPPTSATTPAHPAAAQITIDKMAYSVAGPVKAGQEVTVVNNDEAAHTVTSDTNAFDVRLSGGGGTVTFTAPTAPGTYPFHCKYHANMQGSLVVQ
jgi:plastocyanin